MSQRIGFISTNLSLGGAQKWISSISNLLELRGYDVHVIIFDPTVEISLSKKVKLHFLTTKNTWYKGILKKLILARKLRSLTDKIGGFDLLISTLPYADIITSLSGIKPVNYRIANTLSSEVNALSGFKAKRRLCRYRKVYKDKNLIAVSQGVKYDLVENFGLNEKKITTIYNPVDKRYLVYRSDQICENIPDIPYLIHAGRFTKQKRYDILLDAFKLYLESTEPDFPRKLLLMTKDNQVLTSMIFSRGLEKYVDVIGFKENPFPWYRRASCMILSSDHEGMPNVILESICLGTPVASTDCPSGPREILGETYPECLCPVGDAFALSKSIAKATKLKKNYKNQIIDLFQPDRSVEKIINLCK